MGIGESVVETQRSTSQREQTHNPGPQLSGAGQGWGEGGAPVVAEPATAVAETT